MSDTITITKEEIIDKLTLSSETGEKSIVLFDNSVQMRNFSNDLSTSIRNDSEISISIGTKFRVTNNHAKLNNNTVYFGLKDDEHFLAKRYSKEDIKYYTKGE